MMSRATFLKGLLGMGTTIMGLNALKKWTEDWPSSDEAMMPVLFIGHGSPMNGIEDNLFSNNWKKLAEKLPTPKAVVVVSAHWLTRGTKVTAMSQPKTIHDFGGFPKALFEVQYPAPGDPALAKDIQKLVDHIDIGLDHDWGLDHGAWTVVRNMYPKADIPVLQLSIDYYRPAGYHYELGQALKQLRKKGVLILGSGNMVHNLGMVDWKNLDKPDYGFDWAIEMHQWFNERLLAGDHQALIQYEKKGASALLAVPTPDHYYPLMYALALQDKKDDVYIFNDKLVAGSLNMTSVCFSQ
jgi:4,5-DOPA dioxygenase extradiol